MIPSTVIHFLTTLNTLSVMTLLSQIFFPTHFLLHDHNNNSNIVLSSPFPLLHLSSMWVATDQRTIPMFACSSPYTTNHVHLFYLFFLVPFLLFLNDEHVGKNKYMYSTCTRVSNTKILHHIHINLCMYILYIQNKQTHPKQKV